MTAFTWAAKRTAIAALVFLAIGMITQINPETVGSLIVTCGIPVFLILWIGRMAG